MIVGYARVSKHHQNTHLQKDALKQAGCEKIFIDWASGAKIERKNLLLAFEVLREGDVFVVWRLDRLARSLKHLIELITQLEEKKVGFISLTEAIDTTKAGGKLIFYIFGALAEFERNIIVERTKAGLEAARARGRQGGRPKSLDLKQREVAISLYNEKRHSVKEICNIMGISKPTLYSYLREEEKHHHSNG